MNNLFLYLLVIPLAANFIADFSGLIPKFKYWLFYRIYTKRTKFSYYTIPLIECAMCLSGHITWITAAIQGRNIFEIFILMCASATVGMIINKIGNKI